MALPMILGQLQNCSLEKKQKIGAVSLAEQSRDSREGRAGNGGMKIWGSRELVLNWCPFRLHLSWRKPDLSAESRLWFSFPMVTISIAPERTAWVPAMCMILGAAGNTKSNLRWLSSGEFLLSTQLETTKVTVWLAISMSVSWARACPIAPCSQGTASENPCRLGNGGQAFHGLPQPLVHFLLTRQNQEPVKLALKKSQNGECFSFKVTHLI